MPNDLSAAVSVMTTIDLRGASDWHTMLPRPDVAGEAPTSAVRAILAQVQNEGDAALLALTANTGAGVASLGLAWGCAGTPALGVSDGGHRNRWP